MGINESTIRRIIREEARRVLHEADATDYEDYHNADYVADYLKSIGHPSAEAVRSTRNAMANMGVENPKIYFKQNAEGMAMYTLTRRVNGVSNHIDTISLKQYKDMESGGKFSKERQAQRDQELDDAQNAWSNRRR
jgi:hypothetical protein